MKPYISIGGRHNRGVQTLQRLLLVKDSVFQLVQLSVFLSYLVFLSLQIFLQTGKRLLVLNWLHSFRVLDGKFVLCLAPSLLLEQLDLFLVESLFQSAQGGFQLSDTLLQDPDQVVLLRKLQLPLLFHAVVLDEVLELIDQV